MISKEYTSLNEKLHENPNYGSNGLENFWKIRKLIKKYKPQSILDFGCGKGNLSKSWFLPKITNYDPAIPEYATFPTPHDLVICTDVLEHIEPEYLEATLDELKNLTKKAIYLTIATCPAKKLLPDGRNAHLIQRPFEWWLPKLIERWGIESFGFDEKEAWVICYKQLI